MIKVKRCGAEGCERPSRTWGFCGMHYQRMKNKGSLEPPKLPSKHPLYRIWAGMRSRCFNQNLGWYPRYGGRGITISLEWDDFWRFVADMGPRPSPIHSLDRIDNNGNYCKENCRWATPQQQIENSRRVRFVEHRGEVLHIRAWARRLNVDHAKLLRTMRERGEAGAIDYLLGGAHDQSAGMGSGEGG